MAPPRSKKSKPSIIEILDNSQSFIHERDHDVESSEEESSGSSSSESSEEEQPELGNKSDIVDLDEENADPHADDEEVPLPSPPPTAQKRKRQSKKSKAPAATEPIVVNTTYLLSILSAAELKKPISKRVPKNQSLSLSSSEPWDTMKAQLLVKIDASIKPKQLKIEDYDIMFYIPRILPKPGMTLACETDYSSLLGRVKAMADKTTTPTINISVSQKESNGNKENMGDSEDEEKQEPKSKKKKSKDPSLLPGNIAKASNILLLQERWKCEKREDTCVGTYCYPHPDTKVHLPLNHERFDCWASAILKGEEHATLDKPPNHRMFDAASIRSPVLQRRLDAQNQKNVPLPAPVFNLTIGDGVFDRFLGSRSALPPPTLPLTPLAPAAAVYDLQCPTLLHPARLPGQDMSLTQFCAMFKLGDAVLEKFHENGYNEARVLRFVTIEDLKEMKFRLGEIAALRDAVETWSLPRAA
ncbi:hypothetical protein D9615_006147 [Tricholomella constricta]|uniref:Uncharacterized protein n=1 Tax=Tricholomella constricta TaxID=117010 RepID=A0A8H5M496_9AGAR|nr:hypothetical protein D9615_006147 [Tricholomella constricta]